MSMDFPNPTAVGQTYTNAAGVTYKWNGVAWVSQAAAGGGGGGAPTISTDAGNQTIFGTDSGIYTPLPTVAQIGAAPASHTHTSAQITDFAEAVDDRTAALIKAGANVSVTYDDAANTLTIAAAGGGGGGATISTDAGNQTKLGTDSGIYTPATRAIDANDALPGLRITQTGAGAALLVEDSASPDTTPFTVTTDGKVLVGNTTAQQFMRPGANLVVPPFQINGVTGPDAAASVSAWGADDSAAALVLAKSRGAANGTHGKLLDKDNIGSIVFNASTGTGFVRAGLINVDIDGTPGTGSFPTRLVFGITDASSAAIKEALCINSAQAIGVFGTGSPNYGTDGQVLTSRGPAAGTRWQDPAPTRVIDVSDATPGLRISQRGSGHPFLVEDEATPDATPFVVTANGNVGVGIEVPGTQKLRVQGQDTGSTAAALGVEDSAALQLFRVRNDGQILTGTGLSSPYNNTTATAANLFVTSTGQLQRSTSSIKYKKDVEDLDQALVDNAISKLRPIWYRSKVPNGDDKAEWSHIGLIAEEVAQVEPRLAIFRTMTVEQVEVPVTDENGNPVLTRSGDPAVDIQQRDVVLETPEVESVDYARLSVILLDKVQRLTASLEAMTTKVEALEARLIAVESKPGAA